MTHDHSLSQPLPPRPNRPGDPAVARLIAQVEAARDQLFADWRRQGNSPALRLPHTAIDHAFADIVADC